MQINIIASKLKWPQNYTDRELNITTVFELHLGSNIRSRRMNKFPYSGSHCSYIWKSAPSTAFKVIRPLTMCSTVHGEKWQVLIVKSSDLNVCYQYACYKRRHKASSTGMSVVNAYYMDVFLLQTLLPIYGNSKHYTIPFIYITR